MTAQGHGPLMETAIAFIDKEDRGAGRRVGNDPAAWPGKPDTVCHWMSRRVEHDPESFKEPVEALG